MTDGVRRRAEGGARRRPLARVALLAVPGGLALGGMAGMLLPLTALVPDLILNPASEGGTGSPGYVVIGAQIGLMIGAVVGAVVGWLTAGAVAAAWWLGLPRWAVALAGSSVLTVAVVGFEVGVFGLEAETVAVAGLASLHGAGGVVLLAWIGELTARSA
jgi:hypothetical protein